MYDMGYWLRGVSQAKIESQSNVGVPCEICRAANQIQRIEFRSGPFQERLNSHHVCTDCLDAYRRAAKHFH